MGAADETITDSTQLVTQNMYHGVMINIWQSHEACKSQLPHPHINACTEDMLCDEIAKG